MFALKRTWWIITIFWITITCSFSEKQVSFFSQWVLGIEQIDKNDSLSQNSESEKEEKESEKEEKESEKESEKEEKESEKTFNEKLYIAASNLTNLKRIYLVSDMLFRIHERDAVFRNLTHGDVLTPPPDCFFS